TWPASGRLRGKKKTTLSEKGPGDGRAHRGVDRGAKPGAGGKELAGGGPHPRRVEPRRQRCRRHARRQRMEGKVRVKQFCGLLFLGALAAVCVPGGASFAQSQPAKAEGAGQTEMSLRKSVNTREFQGRQFEGEERQIGRGDSLWRILVEEKGLPGQKFRSYLVVIRGLNPQVKNLDVLRLGDKIFIPLRVEGAVETAREPVQQKPGAIVNYRVKAGDHLYQILREQLKLADERKVAQYYALVKDLNPERKDWDTLLEGETIRLPALGARRPSRRLKSSRRRHWTRARRCARRRGKTWRSLPGSSKRWATKFTRAAKKWCGSARKISASREAPIRSSIIPRCDRNWCSTRTAKFPPRSSPS